MGSSWGAGPPPRPRRPRGCRAPAHVQPQRCTAPRNAFRPPRVAPRTPALCPNPNSPLAPSGSEGCARPPGSKPAPALGQTFQLALVPTTSESGAPGGARGAGWPRANTYRLPAGSGPEPPGWATASQRSTAERQVELHDWGGAGGRPGGQTREQRTQRLRAQSGAGADCAATPRQVSPPEQQCLPRTDLRERSWGSAFPGPCTTEREAKRELDFPKLELDSSLDPYPSPWPSSLLTFFFFFFLRSKESIEEGERCQRFLVIIFFPRDSRAEGKVLGSLNCMFIGTLMGRQVRDDTIEAYLRREQWKTGLNTLERSQRRVVFP